ncbi:MAG: hypothetical protein BWY57_03098 [Betaproteobacteria bacterium ADurb.Bin341]|nr:MAG: hypothetical protein BWY57_03098 [Betaproteobacteria bacterium ADurb.Bin341]
MPHPHRMFTHSVGDASKRVKRDSVSHRGRGPSAPPALHAKHAFNAHPPAGHRFLSKEQFATERVGHAERLMNHDTDMHLSVGARGGRAGGRRGPHQPAADHRDGLARRGAGDQGCRVHRHAFGNGAGRGPDPDPAGGAESNNRGDGAKNLVWPGIALYPRVHGIQDPDAG